MPRRSVGVASGLAWSGVRHRPGGWLLLALGVALAVLLPVVAAGFRTEATVGAIRAAVDTLPVSQRAVLAVTSRDLRADALSSVDRSVRAGFSAADLTEIQQLVTFRPLSVGATDVTLGAADALAADVRLTSGRLPRTCRPSGCEVLAVTMPGRAGLTLPALTRGAGSLGLSITGTAELTDPRLVGVRLAPADLPLLLGDDPAALAELEALTLFGRNTAWLGTLNGTSIAAQGVPRFTSTLAGVADEVNVASGPLGVVWPVDPITAASTRAVASAERFTVLGAGAGALQLGFCLVVAAGMRRRQQLIGQLLTRRGASPGQVLLVATLQPLLAVAAGLAVGVGFGVFVVWVRSRSVVSDPGAAAWGAANDGWPMLLVLSLAAVGVSVAVARWPGEARRSTQLVLDVVGVAAVGAVVLVLVGASGGAAGPLASSVVVLVAVVTGLAAARLWRPLLGLLARPGRAGPVREVAWLGGRRRPLLCMVTAAFVAAACCSLVFAGAYRESLRQSAADQAASQVPLDVKVLPSAQVARPLDVVDPVALRAVAPDVSINPVVSSTVTAFAGTTSVTALPLTGIDPQALTALHEFAATTGSDLRPSELAARIAVAPPGQSAPPEIPAGAHRIGVRVEGMSDAITVTVWLGTSQGQEQGVLLTGAGPDLSAALPEGGTRTVRAIEIAESASHLMHRQHGIGEGNTDRELATGTLTLGGITLDSRAVDWPWTSWGSDQATVSGAGASSLTARYQIANDRVVLTPGFMPRTSLPALPVAVDPSTAARAGTARALGITVNGITVPARVVAVLPRMPGLGATFLLADRAAVTTLLERFAPGTAAVSQVWIAVPAGSLPAVRAALESSPATTATLVYRADLVRTIGSDPVATRSIALLTLAAAAALLLAMVSVATSVRADLAESAADHLALELDGMSARRLRQVLLARWLSVVGVGVLVGVAGGLVLAAVAVRILVDGPGGIPVVPPLRLLVATRQTAAVVGAAVLAGLLACGLATATAFREGLPQAPEMDLR